MPRDPRHFQIAALGALFLYGVLALDFAVSLERAAAIIATALAVQFLATRLVRLPAFDPRSALITAFSLCLLLRTNSTLLAALGAAVAIGSKFTLRLRGRHLFNPANFALAAMMLATGGRVWVSPGQWGSTAFFGFLLLCAGGLVATRARRADVALAFLLAHAALLTGRALWLDDPMTIPIHALESGALLIFAFFMISDPKTTPDTRSGRIFFAVLVALGAYWVRFTLWRSDGIIWSLAALSPLVPLIDWLFCRSPFAKSREETPPQPVSLP